ncbi:MAG: carbon starvation CstA family protein [Rubrivivax sp.]
MLFITIACGACSGFHSIVASGTTSKQLRTERDIKPVAYGAMLLEAMVATFALACVMMMKPGVSTAGTPDAIYARGTGTFMNLCGVQLTFAIGFGLLAFSSFVFDTMDVCTRLGRYVLQEMTGLSGTVGGIVATILTLAGPAAYLSSQPGGQLQDVLDDLRHEQPAAGGTDAGRRQPSGSGGRAGRSGSPSCRRCSCSPRRARCSSSTS